MRGRGHHLKLLTRDEARRIAVNMPSCQICCDPPRPDVDTVNYQVRQSTRNVYVNKINAGSRRCALESRVIKCAWSSLSLLR